MVGLSLPAYARVETLEVGGTGLSLRVRTWDRVGDHV